MARGRVRRDRRNTDIADVVIAEWFRILPATGTGALLKMDANSLTAALNQILEEADRCQVVTDDENAPIKIVIPLPPKKVKNRQDLLLYLQDNDDFRQGMGAAALFGCGR
jgi:hypothetical protein